MCLISSSSISASRVPLRHSPCSVADAVHISHFLIQTLSAIRSLFCSTGGSVCSGRERLFTQDSRRSDSWSTLADLEDGQSHVKHLFYKNSSHCFSRLLCTCNGPSYFKSVSESVMSVVCWHHIVFIASTNNLQVLASIPSSVSTSCEQEPFPHLE